MLFAKLGGGNVWPGTIIETFWFPSWAPACATLLFTHQTTSTKFGPTPSASCPPTSVLHQDLYHSVPCRPTKWCCTTRSNTGDGDAQNSCKITNILAFPIFPIQIFLINQHCPQYVVMFVYKCIVYEPIFFSLYPSMGLATCCLHAPTNSPHCIGSTNSHS